MGSASLLLEHVDKLIDRVDGIAQEGHDSKIKAAWRLNPFKWARERLGLRIIPWSHYCRDKYAAHKWDGTKEPLVECAKALGRGESVAVFSATGTGKTYLGAILVFWFLDCWEGSQVVTLAPKKEQLSLHIWKEIGKHWHLFTKIHPKARYLSGSMQIEMRPHRKDWGAVGFACGVDADEEVAGRARGFHAEHMLFIIEETTGVNPALLNAVKLTCTAPHNIRLFFGNPDSNVDSLSLAAAEAGVTRVRASARDHPNIVANDPTIIPGAASAQKHDEWRLDLGEDSPIFISRTRGIPPAQSMHALIRREWIDAAIERGQNSEAVQVLMKKTAKSAIGADCANSEKGDDAVYVFGKGAVATELWHGKTPDTNAWGRQHLWPFIDSDLVKAKHVGIDTVGVGAGCFNELARLKAHCQKLEGGQWDEYAKGESYASLRAQMYWQARHDLQHGEVAISIKDLAVLKQLTEELIVAKWKTQNSKIKVQPKEEIVEVLGHSPNYADAFVYWNWVRQAQRVRDFSHPSQPVAF